MSALSTPEYYGQNETTVATGGYTNGSGTLNVDAGAPFSTTQQYRVMILDQSTNAVKAILKVTAYSGSAWTVTDDGMDTDAAEGDIVQLCLTSGAMDQIRADMFRSVSSGGSLPTITQEGDLVMKRGGLNLFRATNAKGDAAAFQTWGPIHPTKPVDDSAYSWVNQGSATVVDNSGSVYLTAPAGAGYNVRMRVKSAPSTPYTIIAGLLPYIELQATHYVGIGFRESSSGKLIVVGPTYNTAPRVQVAKYNSATSFSSAVGWKNWTIPRVVFMKLTDNGTTITLSYSLDGINWVSGLSEARGTFFSTAPDQCFLFAESNHASAYAAASFFSWEES